LSERAGSILDALMDCQLTVMIAITSDASKDTPNDQNGKSFLNSKFSSQFFMTNQERGQATMLEMRTHFVNCVIKSIRIWFCVAPMTRRLPVYLVRFAVIKEDKPSSPMAEINSTSKVKAINRLKIIRSWVYSSSISSCRNAYCIG
jgi:hypothetical protein